MPNKNKKRFSRRTQRNNRTRRTIRGGWLSPLRNRYTAWRASRTAAAAAAAAAPSRPGMWARAKNFFTRRANSPIHPATTSSGPPKPQYSHRQAQNPLRDLEKITETQEVSAAGVMNALNRVSNLPSDEDVDAYIGISRNGAAAVDQQRTSSVPRFEFPPAGKMPAVPTRLPPAGQKMINIKRTTPSPYQDGLLRGIVGSKTESGHIKFAARELLKGDESAFSIATFNGMIQCIFIGSRRDEGFPQRRQSPGEWGLNYDFTVKHMVEYMQRNGKASKTYNSQVAKLIEGVNSSIPDLKAKSVNALFPIYMTLRRELACATTLELMTPPYKFDLNQQYAVHIAIPSLITMIENTVDPASLATALDITTTGNFKPLDRVNTITESKQPIYNRFLQYSEYHNRIL